MGFLEIGKLVKDIAAYAATQKQLVAIEVAVRKKQIAPVAVAAILVLFFVTFLLIACAFLLAGLYQSLGMQVLISAGLGFLSVAVFLIIAAIILLLVAKKQGKHTKVKVEK